VDRCALFVDASYALADGALAVHGTRNRDSVSWDYAGLLKLLGGLSRDRTGLPLLRCYWYDMSTDGNRTAEHDVLADIPGLKLRLSKIRPSRKEGVEAEIRKDLTALARNHAISDVIIVTAEEDLAPVIAEIQDLGVRTILLYIAADGDRAVPQTLRQECDDLIEISPGHLRPYVDLISGAEPQLASSGFRELTVNAAHASGPLPAIEAPAQRLYASPMAADYERISADLRANGPADGMTAVTGQRDQRELGGQAQLGGPRYQRPEDGRGPLAAGHEPGFASPGFPAAEPVRAQPGQSPNGFGQRPLPEEGPGQLGAMPGAGSVPTGGPAGMAGQHGQVGDGLAGGAGTSGGNAMAIGRHQDNGIPPAAMPPGGVGGNRPADGIAAHGLPPGAQGTGYSASSQASGMPGNGVPANGLPGNGLPTNGLQPIGQQPMGQPGGSQPVGQQPNGVQPQGSQHGVAQHGVAQQGVAQQGVAQHGAQYGSAPQAGRHQEAARQFGANVSPQSPMPVHPANSGQGPQGISQPGLAPQAQAPHGQQLPGQNLPGQNLPGQNLPGQGLAGQGLPAANQSGQPSQGGNYQNGQPPPEAQRAPSAQRPLPAGNGVQYSPDRAAPYGGQLEPAQFAAPPSNAYLPNPYGGQPPVAPAGAMSVGDAVQSAHAEGFGFGEAVARDAPALWLEAVLARKPRMPSDLEARLLQGSALPIDSLLHDEVRHALRRGFWDALERSRH
jgi:NYN domain-containing protein